MMDESNNFGEKQSIARSLKKYGSTCNHVRNITNDALIRHEIEKTDTLQGIALKYECTMEQLRRANRLFATDSLFLRQFLMVPVERGSPFYPKDLDQRPHSLPSNTRASFTVTGTHPKLLASETTAKSSQSMDSIVALEKCEISPEEEQKKNLDDLLGKIDSTIALSREFVAKSKHNKDFLGDDEDDVDSASYVHVDNGGYYGAESGYQNYNRAASLTASSSSSSSTTHQRNASGSGGSVSFHTNDDTVGLISKTKHVKNSLQRLERQQDELFEL